MNRNGVEMKNRKCVVTGGARGIGFAVAKRLLDAGASVSLWDVDRAVGEQAAMDLGSFGEVFFIQADQTNVDQVQAAAALTKERFGGIDVLINNAGITGRNAVLWEYSQEEWRSVVDVDLNGVFLCCRAVIPIMLEGGYGRIVNVSSVGGKEGNPMLAAYCAAKSGVLGLTKSLGKELAQKNILVNAVTPTAVETEIIQALDPEFVKYMKDKIPMGRLGQPEEVAAMIAWLCSEEMTFSTGATFDISGGRTTY